MICILSEACSSYPTVSMRGCLHACSYMLLCVYTLCNILCGLTCIKLEADPPHYNLPRGSVLEPHAQYDVDSDHVQQEQSQNIYVPLIDVCWNPVSFTTNLDVGCDQSNMLFLKDTVDLVKSCTMYI